MKILIIDDHPMLAAGLISMAREAFPSFHFHTCTTLGEAKEMIAAGGDTPVDLILCDVLLGPENGADLLTYMQSVPGRRIPIVMLSGVTAPATVNSVYQMGAKGFVSKTDNPAVLIEAVKTVLAGGEFFPTRDLNCRSQFLDRALKLTERQRAVLDLAIAGLQNKGIANSLGISEGTVKNYLRSIMSTLAVSTRTQLGVQAARCGYTPRTNVDLTLR
ncbi:response regulator transcription factor [Noviherbaspirillum pedocola]|uniref:Response regulator transcription factor n=1 Tax=Noviherbaspirillum pedocola TaxID=2801341 RepID=A0A934T2I5_9BURK|nr:response regulator transcription factor [Noviherbaspirillum pedocola]MBK4737954.1 response regulator transcription factor [Noviherbaspirillum pedocola]